MRPKQKKRKILHTIFKTNIEVITTGPLYKIITSHSVFVVKNVSFRTINVWSNNFSYFHTKKHFKHFHTLVKHSFFFYLR